MTGYHDHRYYSAIVWLAELFLLAYLSRAGAVGRTVIAATAIASVVATVVATARSAHTPLSQMSRQLDRAPTDSLVACLQRAGATPRDPVFFHLSRTRPPIPWKFGALTGWRVLPQPSNWPRLSPAEQTEFVRRYGVAFVFGTPQREGDPGVPGATPVSCSLPLQRVR